VQPPCSARPAVPRLVRAARPHGPSGGMGGGSWHGTASGVEVARCPSIEQPGSHLLGGWSRCPEVVRTRRLGSCADVPKMLLEVNSPDDHQGL
jgi:hypothetical protein